MAIFIDLLVRHCTGKELPEGIYIPEPGFAIRILPDQTSLHESFVDGDDDYKSPQESKIIVGNVLENRNIREPSKAIVFDREACITIKLPSRMDVSFSPFRMNEGQLVVWSFRLFSKLRSQQMRQSHYRVRQWGLYLLQHKTINRSVLVGNDEFKVTQGHVISLLARIYNHVDPVIMARNLNQTTQSGFQVNLMNTLKNYDPSFYPFKPNLNGKPRSNRLAKIIDAINNLGDAINLLNKMTTDTEFGTKAHLAAKNVHSELVRYFSKVLCMDHIELTIERMARLYFDATNLKRPKSSISLRPEGLLMHILNQGFDSQYLTPGGKLKKEFLKDLNSGVLAIQSPYETKMLHWAAIAGKTSIVKALLTQPKLGKVDDKAEGQFMPLHCALLYCADNGNELELLQLLLNPYTIDHRLSNGRSALVMIIEDLDEPVPVVELLIALDPDRAQEYTLLNDVLSSSHPLQRFNIISAISLFLQRKGRSRNETVNTANELVKRLIHSNASLSIEEWHTVGELDDEASSEPLPEGANAHPFFFAVEFRSYEIMEIFLNEKQLSIYRLKDHNGQAPVEVALESCFEQLPFKIYDSELSSNANLAAYLIIKGASRYVRNLDEYNITDINSILCWNNNRRELKMPDYIVAKKDRKASRAFGRMFAESCAENDVESANFILQLAQDEIIDGSEAHADALSSADFTRSTDSSSIELYPIDDAGIFTSDSAESSSSSSNTSFSSSFFRRKALVKKKKGELQDALEKKNDLNEENSRKRQRSPEYSDEYST